MLLPTPGGNQMGSRPQKLALAGTEISAMLPPAAGHSSPALAHGGSWATAAAQYVTQDSAGKPRVAVTLHSSKLTMQQLMPAGLFTSRECQQATAMYCNLVLHCMACASLADAR
jgi:hypothetical protein